MPNAGLVVSQSPKPSVGVQYGEGDASSGLLWCVLVWVECYPDSLAMRERCRVVQRKEETPQQK